MSASTFLRYLLIPIYKPVAGLQSLLADPRALGYGLLSQLLVGGLYTIAVFIGYRNGFGAVVTPFLNIPAEDYYLWETFLAFIPAAVLMVTFIR